MAAKPETVKLGDKTFEIRRPKLGQLRRIIDALDAMAGKDGGALIDASVDLIVAGLQPTDPDVTADLLLDTETTVAELNTAVSMVLVAAGLRATDTEPGEAGPQPDAS